jgi:hypothetical protein
MRTTTLAEWLIAQRDRRWNIFKQDDIRLSYEEVVQRVRMKSEVE